MDDLHDRTDRFECIAACDGDVLEGFADRVLAAEPTFRVLQDPRPQLVMQRVVEPVERRPFNLGEVLVTPAEVTVDGAKGFAMYPGKAERAALSGAVVDAAVAGNHPLSEEITDELDRVRREHEANRDREWAESRHTTVSFETMEDDL